MPLFRRAAAAVKRANKPAWAALLALAGTYALTRALEKNGATAPPAARKSPLSPLPPLQGWPRWKSILYRTYAGIGETRLLALAAGVVFYGLLALFPAVTALVSSYALFADPATIGANLASLAGLMPKSAYSIVAEQIGRIVGHTNGSLGATFALGLALALWSANAGMKAIIDALNVIYGVKERRGLIALNAVSLAFTAGAIAGLLLALGAVVVLPVWLSYLPLYGYDHAVVAWLRWPALLAALLIGLALLYRYGPDREPRQWQLFKVGTVFAALAWLAGSALLSWYLANFAHYDATYGSLGAGIGLMMWMWMSAIVVLLGAELNSEVAKADG